MLQEFSLENLAAFDGGRVAEAYQQALQRVLADLEDRPALDKARTITLCLELTPLTDPKGYYESADGKFQIKSKVPSHQSKIFNFAPRNVNVKGVEKRQLAFNDLSPGDAQQRTLDEEGGFDPDGPAG